MAASFIMAGSVVVVVEVVVVVVVEVLVVVEVVVLVVVDVVDVVVVVVVDVVVVVVVVVGAYRLHAQYMFPALPATGQYDDALKLNVN